MKIIILTIGSRGDVQPYVALAQGLQQAGHDVTLCTGELFKEMVTTANLGGFLNRLTYKLVPMISAPYSSVINEFRQKLGLKPKGRLIDETKLPDGRATPVMYGYSNHVLPRPTDWPETTVATGYWFLPADETWQPPADLCAFLQAGTPPVYVGFGSMAGTEPERLAGVVIDALQKTGQRGVLATGWGGLKPGDLPDSIFKLESAPHDWLLPQMAAIVHHGGSGTTAAGLRAGKPSLSCPFTGDQPFWGERVYRLGAGPQPIKQKKLTVEAMAMAVTQMVNTPAMQQNAAAVGARIRAEDGIANAVHFVDGILYGTR